MQADTKKREPSLLRIAYFFLPLALTGFLMSAGQPIIHAGLSRLHNPELILAAFSMAFYAAILIESPIIMLFVASNALVVDERNYHLTKQCMLAVNIFLTLLIALIALHVPTYEFVTITLLQYPTEVAETARPAMLVLILWPGLIGVRRYYNGILTRFGWTAIIGWSTAVRLLVMLIVTFVGVMWFPHYGVIVGAVALALGVVSDTIIALVASRKLFIENPLPEVSDEENPLQSRTPMGFFKFFVPLAVTSGLRIVARPLMFSGIARGIAPVLSLAAFPVALGTMSLFELHLQMLQQVVVAWVKDISTFEAVRKFVWIISLASAGILVVVAVTSLGSFYHETVIGLVGETLNAANTSLIFLAIVPLLTGIQAYNQGLLIRAGKTVAVNVAALINLLLLVGALNITVVHVDFPAYILAGIFMPMALVVEVVLLFLWNRKTIKEIYEENSVPTSEEV